MIRFADMLNYTLGFILLLGGSTEAFSASHQRIPRSTTGESSSSSTDISEAINKALRLSKKYGASSPQARDAWDLVDDSSTLKTFLYHEDERKNVSDDYHHHVHELSKTLTRAQETLDHIQNLTEKIRKMELKDPSLSKLPDHQALSPSASRKTHKLKQLLQEAKATSELYGAGSSDAETAWDAVQACLENESEDECSLDTVNRYNAVALEYHHMYDAVVDADLLEEASYAVDILTQLRRVIKVEDHRFGGENRGLSM